MIPLIGYTNALSFRPGEAVEVKVSSTLNQSYQAELGRIISGDPNAVSGKISEILALIPQELSLDGNYPNPFTPITTIRFGLPQPRDVRITVVNLLGQEITELVNGWKDIGRHEVVWHGQDQNGKQVASGMYFYRVIASDFVSVKKLLLMK